MNSVNLVGYLGADATGKAVANSHVINFSLATNYSFKTKDGERKSETEWHTIEYWGSEKLVPVLTKGQLVALTGRIKTEEYPHKTHPDVVVKKVVIVADSVEFLGGKDSSF